MRLYHHHHHEGELKKDTELQEVVRVSVVLQCRHVLPPSLNF
ncbi:uncharacterized, partial [Tachysurus ichikawai]